MPLTHPEPQFGGDFSKLDIDNEIKHNPFLQQLLSLTNGCKLGKPLMNQQKRKSEQLMWHLAKELLETRFFARGWELAAVNASPQNPKRRREDDEEENTSKHVQLSGPTRAATTSASSDLAAAPEAGNQQQFVFGGQRISKPFEQRKIVTALSRLGKLPQTAPKGQKGAGVAVGAASAHRNWTPVVSGLGATQTPRYPNSFPTLAVQFQTYNSQAPPFQQLQVQTRLQTLFAQQLSTPHVAEGSMQAQGAATAEPHASSHVTAPGNTMPLIRLPQLPVQVLPPVVEYAPVPPGESVKSGAYQSAPILLSVSTSGQNITAAHPQGVSTEQQPQAEEPTGQSYMEIESETPNIRGKVDDIFAPYAPYAPGTSFAVQQQHDRFAEGIMDAPNLQVSGQEAMAPGVMLHHGIQQNQTGTTEVPYQVLPNSENGPQQPFTSQGSAPGAGAQEFYDWSTTLEELGVNIGPAVVDDSGMEGIENEFFRIFST